MEQAKIGFWNDAVKDRKNKMYLPFYKYWYYAFRLFLFRKPIKIVHISRFARKLFAEQYGSLVIVADKTYCKWGILLAGFKLKKRQIEYKSFGELE